MPKNKGKGGKKWKRGKGGADDSEAKRELPLKEEGQEYAVVTRMMGNGRVQARCADGKTRLCVIRGAMLKKVWVAVDDTILVGLRGFATKDDKADVIHKYNSDEVAELTRLTGSHPVPSGAAPTNAGGKDASPADDDDDCAFDFRSI